MFRRACVPPPFAPAWRPLFGSGEPVGDELQMTALQGAQAYSLRRLLNVVLCEAIGRSSLRGYCRCHIPSGLEQAPRSSSDPPLKRRSLEGHPKP